MSGSSLSLSWSAVAFSRSISMELVRDPSCAWENFSMCANLKFTYSGYIHSLNLSFQYMATRRQTYRYINTRVLQCSHASVGLAQARPKDRHTGTYIHTVLQCSHASVGLTQARPKLLLHMLETQVIACLSLSMFLLPPGLLHLSLFEWWWLNYLWWWRKTVKADRETRGGGCFLLTTKAPEIL